MSDHLLAEKGFIEQAEALILENVSNEKFGVSELAAAMHMSRSSLLRKVKKAVGLPVTQFIREIRLKKGMEMLRQGSFSISEISYQVGFGSSSYFIKCFREYYGYSPGEVGKQKRPMDVEDSDPKHKVSKWPIVQGVALLLLIISFSIYHAFSPSASPIEKSVAVLPFKNESNDASNRYFVNGLMETALGNLQKVKDLRVVSRTSVEKYRDTQMTSPEIAKELNVSYLVEGSGQRSGDQILLNIQLVEASTDKQLWAAQYNRRVEDVFALQNEIAGKVTAAIEAVVTLTELEQIKKKPTENLLAYDYYLRAVDLFYDRTSVSLKKGIALCEKAIEYDTQFSLAYAHIAVSYFLLDMDQAEKKYTDLINIYADQALLYDAKSAESLISKAMYYMHNREYRLALPHLHKALEYNPNSYAVVQLLSDIYAQHLPNTAKYLEYALKGIQLDINANDSTSKSYVYLHLSNAFLQSGFIDEALTYVDLSLSYFPESYFAPYAKIFIQHAKELNIEQTTERLVQEWRQDTTRLDILQEVGRIFYFQEKYDSAFHYYEKLVKARSENNLDMFTQENGKISLVYEKMGLTEEASFLFKSYAEYWEKDPSIYKSINMANVYTYEGKFDLAIEQLKLFATEENYQYWILLFLEMDPLLKPLKSHPEFNSVLTKIKDHFLENQVNVKKSLQDKGLI